MDKSKIGKVIYPEWITTAQEQLNKKNYALFLQILADVVVYGEIPSTYDQETKAYKLFKTLKILPNVKTKMNKYESKLKRNRNENEVQNTDNQECDLGKYRDIEIKEIIEIGPSYSSSNTSNISTPIDDKDDDSDELEINSNLNIETMNEKVTDTKWDDEMFQRMNERKKVILASIEKFIEAVPTLTDEQINSYVELYTNKLREVYYRQDYAENMVTMMVGRIAKVKSKGSYTPTPSNKPVMVTPPRWILDDLPKVDVCSARMNVVHYIQAVNDRLTIDSHSEYADNVEGYKNWYVHTLLNTYAPKVLECDEVKGRNTTLDDVKAWIIDVWNKDCPKFQLD